MQVPRHDIGERIAAAELPRVNGRADGERGTIAVAPVEDGAVEQLDRLLQPIGRDIGHQVVEVIALDQWK